MCTDYDFFVSHTSADKDGAADPIARGLEARGYTVWYDKITLKLGDSLRGKIDAGLAACKYGVVILSPRFFEKGWPLAELDALASREYQEKKKLILPVWHEIDHEGVAKHSPLLAGKLGTSTARGIEAVLDEIEDVIKDDTGAASSTETSPSSATTSSGRRDLSQTQLQLSALLAWAKAVKRPFGGQPAYLRTRPMTPDLDSDSPVALAATNLEQVVVSLNNLIGQGVLGTDPMKDARLLDPLRGGLSQRAGDLTTAVMDEGGRLGIPVR